MRRALSHDSIVWLEKLSEGHFLENDASLDFEPHSFDFFESIDSGRPLDGEGGIAVPLLRLF